MRATQHEEANDRLAKMKLKLNLSLILLLVFNLIAKYSFEQIVAQPNSLSLCFGSNGKLIISSNSTDSYKWQDSTATGWQNLNNGSIFTGVTNDTLSITNANLTITNKRFRCIVDSANLGIRRDTSSSCILTVFPSLTKPIIVSNQTICNNTSPDTLIQTQGATGANGNFTYQWQVSVNGSTWNLIAGQTSIKYKPGNLIANRFYRTLASSTFGCGTINSDSLLITVRDTLNAGIIGVSQNICYNSSPNNITFTTAASGTGGGYSYQWQSSTDSLNYSDIIGANSTTFNPGILTSTKFYRVKVTSNLGCGIQFTNRIKILVFPVFQKALIGSSSQLCFNGVSDTIKILTFPLGGNGIYAYQWLGSSDSVNWTSILGQNQNSYFPGNLTSTRYFRVISSSGLGCGIDTSNLVKIHVFPDLTKPSISGAQSICYNNSPDSLTRISPATGANGVFSYLWQSSLDGINWTNIVGSTGIKYKPQNLLVSTFFRIVATSNNGCGSIGSDSLKVIVFDSLNQGYIGTSQNICYNTIPSRLTFNQAPIGGGGNYSLMWQVSSDSINFVNIIGSDSLGHQPLSLTTTKYYRSIVTSTLGCGVKNTNVVKIRVYGLFRPASIIHTDASPICYLTTSDTLKIGINPIGGNLNYSFQWLESSDSMNWISITGQTQNQFKSQSLSFSKFYRLISSSGESCGSDSSNILKVNVLPNIQKAVIGTPQNICYNTSADTIRMLSPAIGANGSFRYNWQISTNGILWTPILNDTNSTLSTGKLQTSKYYRLLATSNYGCGSKASDSVFVLVYSDLNSGVIGSNQNICYNSNPSNLAFSSNPNGGGSIYSYLWQNSIDSINYVSRPTDTTNLLSLGKLLNTTYYRLLVTSKEGCGQLATNAIRIRVYEPFNPASILSNQQICFDGLADTIKVGQNPSGGNLTYTYNWNVSSDSINWTVLPGQNNKFYNAGRLRASKFYKLESTSGQSCGSGFSNVVKLNVNPLPDTSIIMGNENFCRNKRDEIFELSNSSVNYLYNWQLKGGEVISGANLPKAYINWFDSAMYDTIKVNQINKITGCFNTMIKPVEILNSRAPDKTSIIRKPNSNILVCEDASPGINYQWGYTVKSSGIDSLLPNGNLRYVQLSHNMDTNLFSYWVITSTINSGIVSL